MASVVFLCETGNVVRVRNDGDRIQVSIRRATDVASSDPSYLHSESMHRNEPSGVRHYQFPFLTFALPDTMD